MTDNVQSRDDASATAWYALTPEDVATRLDVDPAQGLSAANAAELLQQARCPSRGSGRAGGSTRPGDTR